MIRRLVLALGLLLALGGGAQAQTIVLGLNAGNPCQIGATGCKLPVTTVAGGGGGGAQGMILLGVDGGGNPCSIGVNANCSMPVSGVASGFPITIGSTPIAANSTTTTIAGLTLTGGTLTTTTISGLTVSTTTGTLTIANGKTATVSNTLTLAGTDGSTLNVGAGGTLGTAAFVNTGTSGGTVPLLNAANTASISSGANTWEFDNLGTGRALLLNSAQTDTHEVLAIFKNNLGTEIFAVQANGSILTNGSAGSSRTCTVNQALTLIFTNGILTGGTCNS